LTWQSQVGPKAWQGPQTADAIEGLAKQGHTDVCLVPIAFTSDHIETLYELDIEVQEDAHKLGLNMIRAESLNDSPIFVRAIADLVSGHLDDYDAGKIGPASRQLMLRCPGCTNAKCGVTKEWLAQGGDSARM
jgi:ferrochelatase